MLEAGAERVGATRSITIIEGLEERMAAEGVSALTV